MFAMFLPCARSPALLLDGSIFFDIGTVLTVFLPPAADSPRPRLPFELTLCCRRRRARCAPAQDIDVSVNAGLEALDDADLIIVPRRAPAMVPGQDAPRGGAAPRARSAARG